eukprot:2006952-Prymnesium_polylepis.1
MEGEAGCRIRPMRRLRGRALRRLPTRCPLVSPPVYSCGARMRGEEASNLSHAPTPPPRSCVDAGVAGAAGGLADRDDLARKPVKAPSLLDPCVRRASAPPLYIHLHRWSCSVALRPPPTWPSLMR